MATPTYNYLWPQGEDLVISFRYSEGPDGSEVPVDLTGYTVRMDIMNSANGNLVYTFNTAEQTDPDEITVTNDGWVNIVVPRALTLPPSGAIYTLMGGGNPVLVYNYDIFLRKPIGAGGTQKKLFRGTVTIEPSYTLWA